MTTVLRTKILSDFTCLGDRCSDTCCKGWSMQVDEGTLARYRKDAPELLAAVEEEGGGHIMKKAAGGGACVKLEDGLCGIQKKHGAGFLGDACYFYPRVTRALGDKVIMTAALSCPEIARLALYSEEKPVLSPHEAERLPLSLKNYLPDGLTSDEALAIHQSFIDAALEPGVSAEHCFLRIATVSRFIERNEIHEWPKAVPFFLKHADSYIPAGEVNPADPFNLLHALVGLIIASHKTVSDPLKQTIADMEKALAVTLDWERILITADEKSLAAYQDIREGWAKNTTVYDPLLKKFLGMQLSLALYPFSGFGKSLTERATVIGVRLCTLRLALLCGCAMNGGVLSQDITVRIVQSLSRFLDHLGDPGFSLQIYSETGWINESRMRGMLEN